MQLMAFDNAIQLDYKDQVITKILPGSEFTAPEVFMSRYTRKIDEYAVGVLMYYLFSGFAFPFRLSPQNSDKEQFWALINQDLSFADDVWMNYAHFF